MSVWAATPPVVVPTLCGGAFYPSGVCTVSYVSAVSSSPVESGPGLAGDSTKQRVLRAALDLFVARGYAGTSLRQIASGMDFSVAALCYHFRFKEELLLALTEPLLDGRDECLARFEAEAPLQLQDKRRLLDSYLSLLLSDVQVTRFVTQDPAVRHHRLIGPRVDDGMHRFQRLLVGPEGDASDIVLAEAAIGAFCRPIVVLPDVDLGGFRDRLVDAALAVIQSGQ